MDKTNEVIDAINNVATELMSLGTDAADQPATDMLCSAILEASQQIAEALADLQGAIRYAADTVGGALGAKR